MICLWKYIGMFLSLFLLPLVWTSGASSSVFHLIVNFKETQWKCLLCVHLSFRQSWQKKKKTQKRLANISSVYCSSRTYFCDNSSSLRNEIIAGEVLVYQISVKLRTTACKYGDSDDRTENWNFHLLPQEDPSGELFANISFKRSSQFTVFCEVVGSST